MVKNRFIFNLVAVYVRQRYKKERQAISSPRNHIKKSKSYKKGETAYIITRKTFCEKHCDYKRETLLLSILLLMLVIIHRHKNKTHNEILETI